MKYSQNEIDLLIELRNAGYIGQRLCIEFRKVFPDRTNDRSIKKKIQNLRIAKEIIR